MKGRRWAKKIGKAQIYLYLPYKPENQEKLPIINGTRNRVSKVINRGSKGQCSFIQRK